MVNNFDILKEMSRRNMDIRLSKLDNVTHLEFTRKGTKVTIGVAGNVYAGIVEGKLNGGLLLWDQSQYETVAKELDEQHQAG